MEIEIASIFRSTEKSCKERGNKMIKKKLSIITLSLLTLFSTICLGQNMPEFFGVYIVANGKVIEIPENTIELKTPNKGGMQEECLAGIRELSKVDIKDESAYIIIFLENVDINSLELSKLRYARTEFLNSTPILGNTEKVRTNINMWVIEKDIPFRKGPIEGKKGMYKIVPSAGFEPGVYAIHGGGIRNFVVSGGYLGLQLERTESGNSAYAFSFKIAESKGRAEPEPGPEPNDTISEEGSGDNLPSVALSDTYVYKYNRKSFIEFKQDGTFFSQVKTTKGIIFIEGTYKFDGENLYLYTSDGKIGKAKMRGDTITDDDGMQWRRKK